MVFALSEYSSVVKYLRNNFYTHFTLYNFLLTSILYHIGIYYIIKY